jgi:y4mF family transcriptional regulator
MQFKNMSELALIIKAKRKEQGLTQNDLALASNVGIRFIVDIEAGKETAQIGKVLKVCAMLGLKLGVINE